MADVSVLQQGKRRRGRPRKDTRDGESVIKIQHVPDKNLNNGCGDMVGSVVYGVIEGSFDAGYLISVTIGNERTPFRGVVFQPKKIVPISAANDIAPQAKMYERRAIPVPDTENQKQTSVIITPERASKQAVVRPPFPTMDLAKTTTTTVVVGDDVNVDPGRSLRMVEEDEVMQAFEVSTSNHHKNMSIDHPTVPLGATIELLHQTPNTELEEVQQPVYYNGTDVSFHQNLFNEPKSLSEAQFHQDDFVSTSHDLKLSLDKVEPQSETSYGFHQALVAGNPLLLPPDLTMEKPNTEQEQESRMQDFVLNDHQTETTHTPHSTH